MIWSVVPDVLEFVLGGAPEAAPLDGVDDWWARHLRVTAPFAAPIDQAVAGGFHADRLGWAFASGYRAALAALVPGIPAAEPVALAITEEGGGHPRAIRTTLTPAGEDRLRLDGRKRWTTLGTHAAVLLVAASEGEEPDGRSRLRLVRVDARRPGVSATAMPAPPFAPEVPHAEVTLAGVEVAAADVLPGEAWPRYIKPFRTLEDTHVHAAILGWLARIARRHGWPRTVLGDLAALIVTARAVAAMDPLAAATHVALAGLLEAARRLVAACRPHWELVDAATRARFDRDAPLLVVAERARALRLEAAWKALAGG